MGKKKEKIEFRYYELPQDEWVMVLAGQKWTRIYGHNVTGLHFHNLLEIGYCIDGTGDLILEDESYRFKEEMISVIPARFPHTTLSDTDVLGTWEYIFIDVEGFVREFYKESPLFARQLIEGINKYALFVESKENERMRCLIKGIIDEAVHKRALYLESIKGLMIALLLEIIRMNEDQSDKNKIHKPNHMQIKHALAYVDENYAKPIKIEVLAKTCHMSEAHFRRLFGAYMNMTPLEYIHLIRIQKACELIKKTHDSIGNIAIKVGYLSPSTFDRNFKRIVGKSPNEWRMQSENYEGRLLNYNISTLKGW